jgi:hypothetical protein
MWPHLRLIERAREAGLAPEAEVHIQAIRRRIEAAERRLWASHAGTAGA